MKTSHAYINRWKHVLESEWYENIFNIYSDIIKYTNKFYMEKGFSAAALPITTTSISSPMGLGSDSIPVQIDLHGQKTYLADSMQFLLEYTLRFNKKGVYYVMPSFRGEDSDERHLNQFYHSEVEIVGDLNHIIKLAEDYIKNITEQIIESNYYKSMEINKDQLEYIKSVLSKNNFSRVHFADAVNLLQRELPEGIDKEGDFININSNGEKYLINKFDGVLWLTHFEHKSVPFYQQYDPRSSQYALAADLLLGMGETLGCGERADYISVQKSLKDHEVNEEDYRWYIEMKKEFPMQTSGFGLGIERYIAWLTGNYDIREIPIVYRDKNLKVEP